MDIGVKFLAFFFFFGGGGGGGGGVGFRVDLFLLASKNKPSKKESPKPSELGMWIISLSSE